MNYADLLIQKMIQNAIIFYKTSFSLKQMFDEFDAVLRKQLRNEEVLTEKSLIQSIKKLQKAKKVNFGFENGVLTKLELKADENEIDIE